MIESFSLYNITHKNPVMIMSGTLAKASSFPKPFFYMIGSDPKTVMSHCPGTNGDHRFTGGETKVQR